MSLNDLIVALSRYIAELLGKRFTGKIIVTINTRSGGIGGVKVSTEHELGRQDDNENSVM